MAKILVVEDDQSVAVSIKELLEMEHHMVDLANDGDTAGDYLSAFSYDLVILDWQVPKTTGVAICRQYRTISSGPVLMLTGMNSTANKVEGLEAGADDYLTKPFATEELIARVRALLRRPSELICDDIRLGDLHVNRRSRIVKKAGKTLDLTPREYDVLEFFLKHPNQVISPEALIKRVWHSDSDASPHAVYTCLNRLRKNLNAKDKEELIKTVHGMGYRLDQ